MPKCMICCIRRPVAHKEKVDFPDNSVGKESTYNAGDLSSIPGSGRYTGEGIGYLFQYSWASFVTQLVKNLPGMWETWVRSLGWRDPLEKGKTTHYSILPWKVPWAIQSMRSQRNQPWIFTRMTDAESQASILWLLKVKHWLIGKDPAAGKGWGQKENMVGKDEKIR